MKKDEAIQIQWGDRMFFIHIIDQILLHIKQAHFQHRHICHQVWVTQSFPSIFSPIVLHNLRWYICEPCYIHNSVITIAAKGMSTNCYVYNTILLHNLRCYICDPCYIHNSVTTIAAIGMSINCLCIYHQSHLCFQNCS